MSESVDSTFERFNKVLDTVTVTVSNISKEREKMNKEHITSISNLSLVIDDKMDALKRDIINDMIEDSITIRSKNKTVHSGFDKRIISLEHQIVLMNEAIKSLKTKHDENIVIINELRPKVGKKRKWWQRGI